MAQVIGGIAGAAILYFIASGQDGFQVGGFASNGFGEPWALQQLWLFWVAPIVGGAIGGVVYPLVAGNGD